jgi:hypothetical protein
MLCTKGRACNAWLNFKECKFQEGNLLKRYIRLFTIIITCKGEDFLLLFFFCGRNDELNIVQNMLHLEPIPLVPFPTSLKHDPEVQLSRRDCF